VNLAAGAPLWLVALLALCLVAAAVEDAVRLRISNVTCLAVLFTAVVAMALQGFPAELWQNLLVFALILAIGTPAFAAGWLGGGDVKLLAAVGLWMSLPAASWLIASVFIAGGVLAFAFIIARLLRRQTDGQSKKRQTSRIPYGLAIVVGAAFVFAMQMGFGPRERPHPFTLRASSK
jgi:prepilin peptidase CpaA